MPLVCRSEIARLMASEKTKRKKFDYARLKSIATSSDREERKAIFIEYFEDFHEFPSYLFDNEREIDLTLFETMQDLLKDPTTGKDMRKGVEELLNRLPSRLGGEQR